MYQNIHRFATERPILPVTFNFHLFNFPLDKMKIFT